MDTMQKPAAKNHPYWKTVGEVKRTLNQFDDNDLVFIEPFEDMTQFPFYIEGKNGYVRLRLYSTVTLKLMFKLWVNSVQMKKRVRRKNGVK